MDNKEKNSLEEIDLTKPDKKKFIKIFRIITYFVVFALGYEASTISYNKNFGNVPGTTINKLNTIEQIIDQNYYKSYDKGELYDFVESMMVYGLNDPFSYHLDKDEKEEFSETIEGKYVGVGLTLTPSENGEILIIAPFDGSPAQNAGILKNDIIAKINGKAYMYADVDEAISLMKGKEGEKVELEIKREGTENFEVTLIKEEIIYRSVDSRRINDNTIYVRISRFDMNTYDDFVSELEKYECDENTGLILDLRDNPGGTVHTAVAIADLFIDEGKIITERYRNKKDIVEKATDGHINIKYPIALLTNSSSASASEILAGALKDHKKAYLIGEKTFGKGLINQQFRIDAENSIVLSIAEYQTPSGTKIHSVGIEPDLAVEMELEKSILALEEEEDIQLKSAVEYLSPVSVISEESE